MSKSNCTHADYRPTVKLTEAESLVRAREARAVFAAEVVAAKEQLRRDELRASLHLGLVVSGAYDAAEQHADASATCEKLRKQIVELEDRCKALEVAIDFFEARDLRRKMTEASRELEAAQAEIARSFPDAEQLVRAKNRLAAAGVAFSIGGLSFSQENALNLSQETRQRIAEYLAMVEAATAAGSRATSVHASLGEIRQKYGNLSDIVLQP